MRICLDTNVLVQLFGMRQPFGPIVDALLAGRLEWAVSNEVLFECEETITTLSGRAAWTRLWAFMNHVSRLRGNILFTEPHYRFGVISQDPDDNKFVDCAVAANVDFIVTWDNHFEALRHAGYKPQPISPEEFIATCL